MSQQIYELIPKIMQEVGAIEKGRRNEAQKFFFRGIDDVMGAFQPVLARHRVFYIPEVLEKHVEERPTKNGGSMIYTTLTVAYTLFAPDGSSVRAIVVGEAADSGDKSSNKAMSAALKYLLLQIFCVPTEANEDADAHSPDLAPKVKQEPTLDESLRVAIGYFKVEANSPAEAEFVMDALGLNEPTLARNLNEGLKAELLTRLRHRVKEANAKAKAA